MVLGSSPEPLSYFKPTESGRQPAGDVVEDAPGISLSSRFLYHSAGPAG
jgi:hypothetical protein